jgi:hypothetical protein
MSGMNWAFHRQDGILAPLTLLRLNLPRTLGNKHFQHNAKMAKTEAMMATM